jgi:carbon-monoxide dehydrogenase large subunit
MSTWVGTRVERREDERLLRGRGTFVDDLHPAGCLHAAVLRSPHAHARILSIDASAAGELPGVHAIFTAEDLGDVNRPFPLTVPHPKLRARTATPFAAGKVRYVGEPVALIVADDRYIAEDALDLIAVDYDVLPATPTLEAAAEDREHPVHEDLGDNIAAVFGQSYGDLEAAFAQAEIRFTERFVSDRGAGQPMETRVVMAVPSEFEGVTVWDGTQTPHVARRLIADALKIGDERVRVVAPDVGGGFGPKAVFYPEEVLIPFAALRLRRPVKWIEDRLEHFRSTNHERTQIHEVEVAARKDGTLLGLRARFLHDSGAYVPWGVIVPFITIATIPGPYRLPAYSGEARVVYTNRVPVTPHRGAGRPQAVFVMERVMDRLADETGLDRSEVRMRNYVQTEQMPYNVGLIFRDGSPMVYDSGDYPECQRVALGAVDQQWFEQKKREAREKGKLVGLGLATYVEGTGLGPHESARLRVTSNGEIHISSGAASQGQGHQTTLAQVAADALGVEMDRIVVITGDTARVPYGIGAFASRLGPLANSAVRLAATELRTKIVNAAAAMFEAAPEDLEIEGGDVIVRGSPDHRISLGNLAVYAGGAFPGSTLSEDLNEIGLESTAYFRPKQSTYASGSHTVVVEVDPQTGQVQILQYAVAHDCGNVINPLIVDGQVQGGVAAGIGGTLFENLLYDESGQLITGSFVDFLLPTAAEVPPVVIEHVEAPTPLNPMGSKGAGEGGTIPAAAAIVSAIENALWPGGGLHIRHFPLTPEDILKFAREAGAGETLA